ncbi:fatty acid hydroxylase domain-containing protein 2-like [Glandiceps talaboti]
MERDQILNKPSCRSDVQLSTEPKTYRLTLLIDTLKQYSLYLFVTGAAICVFAAARNTIIWHVQHVWRGSGDFCQYGWLQVYETFDGNQWAIGVYGTLVVITVPYWILASLFLFVDVTGRPEFIVRYKVQPDKNAPVDPVKLRKAILTVLFNQIVVNFCLIPVVYPLYVWRGVHLSSELPSFHWVLIELTVFLLVEEVGFYYSHRLLHHPMLYKHIHKIHHEWTAPICIISIYSHPIEHIMSNMLPPMLGPLLMGSHVATAWLWFVMALNSTLIAHSGYHLPFLPSNEAHDFHHVSFVNNFGVLGVLDHLHGTDKLFRASKAYQRNYVSFCWTPLLQLVPDDPKIKPQ